MTVAGNGALSGFSGQGVFHFWPLRIPGVAQWFCHRFKEPLSWGGWPSAIFGLSAGRRSGPVFRNHPPQ